MRSRPSGVSVVVVLLVAMLVAGLAAPATARQTLPTGINRVDADLSSTRSGDGSGAVPVNVAVIDSGVEAHPDLNVKGRKDCSSAGDPYDPWHGTMVAGALGAKDDKAGVVGVVPGANLYEVRIDSYFLEAPHPDVVCALDWVASTRTDADPGNDIAVANMSNLGSGVDDGNCGYTNGDELHQAVCRAVAAGVVVVAAAGNKPPEDFASYVPGSYDEVLTVTAMSDSDGKPGQQGRTPSCAPAERDEVYATFSKWATTVADQSHTVAAPGVCIYTTAVGGGYGYASGTSMATPHVSGTVALCIYRGRCAGSPAQVIQKIRSDAEAYNRAVATFGFWGDPLRPVPDRYYGYLIRTAGY